MGQKLTFMAISAGKARVTGAGEVAAGLTDAVAVRATYVR